MAYLESLYLADLYLGEFSEEEEPVEPEEPEDPGPPTDVEFDVLLMEMRPFDPTAGAVVVLRCADGAGLTTGPDDTPASVHWHPRISGGPRTQRDIFERGTTGGRSRGAGGMVDFANADGGIDHWITYAWDGRPYWLWLGPEGGRFPADFRLVARGRTMPPNFSLGAVSVPLVDRQAELDVPLQANRYLGDGSPTEGGAELAGKPKPLLWGRTDNAPALLVDPARQIWQYHDGAAVLLDVKDRGFSLGSSPAGSASDVSTSTGFGSDTIRRLLYGATWVAMGEGGALETSPDRATWTPRASGLAEIHGGAYTPQGVGVYLIVGEDNSDPGFTVSVSFNDGATWTPIEMPSTEIMRDAAYGSSRWVAVGDGGVIQALTVNGGSPAIVETASGALSKVAASPAGFLAVGPGGLVALGTFDTFSLAWTWVESGDIPGAADCTAVVRGKSRWFVASGASVWGSTPNGAWYTSANWTDLGNPFGGSELPLALAYSGGILYAAGEDGKAAYSDDEGATWSPITTGITDDILTIAIGDGAILFAGASGAMAEGGTGGGGGSGSGGGDFSDYADLDELLAVTPEPKTYRALPSLGLFRLGGSPVGRVTFDAVQGATAADRTAAQAFVWGLERVGKTSDDWRAADITALDLAAPQELGIWAGPEERTLADWLDEVAGSVGAWWGTDSLDVFRVQQLRAPEDLTATHEITQETMLADRLERVEVADDTRGIPSHRSVVRYGYNHAPMSVDIALGVSDERRAELEKEWRLAEAEDPAVREVHLLSPEVVEDTALVTLADAQAEADRRQALRGVRRDRVRVLQPLTAATIDIDLADVPLVSHDRYGLAEGKRFSVIGIGRDYSAGRHGRTQVLDCWGARFGGVFTPEPGPDLVRTAEGLLFLDDFDRAEIGDDWVVRAGTWVIDGSERLSCTTASSSGRLSIECVSVDVGKVFVQTRMGAVNGSGTAGPGIWARMDNESTRNGYLYEWEPVFAGSRMRRFVSSTEVNLASGGQGGVAGASDRSMQLYVADGVQLGRLWNGTSYITRSTTDTTYNATTAHFGLGVTTHYGGATGRFSYVLACSDRIITVTGESGTGWKAKILTAGAATVLTATESSGTATLTATDINTDAAVPLAGWPTLVITDPADNVLATWTGAMYPGDTFTWAGSV